MHTTTTISHDLHRVIMLRSHHRRNTPRSKAPSKVSRKEADYGSKSYTDGLQRAFNRAKQQVFFNPDMTNFITLTYKGADQSVETVLRDIKIMIAKEKRLAESNPVGNGRERKLKYIFIMEYQKRGSIHVHMIANDSFTLQVNNNGFKELKYWQKGFSSVLQINDFDNNFRPQLYLFKYMRKAQRIGKSVVHASRNLNNCTELKDSEINLIQWRTLIQERSEHHIQDQHFYFYRNYMQFDDTMTLPTTNQGDQLWLEQVKLHSMRVQAKLLRNLTSG